MKKILCALVVLVSIGATAQTKGDVEFGLNVGYNSSLVSVDNFSTENGDGLNIGFATDFYFSDRWSIKAKLIYDQKGWNKGFYEEINNNPSSGNSYYITNYNLNYLTIPLMANWHFGSKRNWYLNFGPYAGFLLNAKETKGSRDVTDRFNTTDFGLALGIGVKIPLNEKLKLSFEYDAQSGISDIFKDNDLSTARNARSSLNVGLSFMLK